MACSDGVFVFEIGARGGATGLPEVVRDYSGVDLYQVALDLALGDPRDVHPPRNAGGDVIADLRYQWC